MLRLRSKNGKSPVPLCFFCFRFLPVVSSFSFSTRACFERVCVPMCAYVRICAHIWEYKRIYENIWERMRIYENIWEGQKKAFVIFYPLLLVFFFSFFTRFPLPIFFGLLPVTEGLQKKNTWKLLAQKSTDKCVMQQEVTEEQTDWQSDLKVFFLEFNLKEYKWSTRALTNVTLTACLKAQPLPSAVLLLRGFRRWTPELLTGSAASLLGQLLAMRRASPSWD